MRRVVFHDGAIAFGVRRRDGSVDIRVTHPADEGSVTLILSDRGALLLADVLQELSGVASLRLRAKPARPALEIPPINEIAVAARKREVARIRAAGWPEGKAIPFYGRRRSDGGDVVWRERAR